MGVYETSKNTITSIQLEGSVTWEPGGDNNVHIETELELFASNKCKAIYVN